MRHKLVALAAVAGSAVVAYAAVGNGDIVATAPVTVVTITSPTGSGSGTATLQNTTSATSYSVLLGSDATCDPGVTFTVAGGNPIASFAASTSRDITFNCPPRGTEAMQRCRLHATNNSNGTALADIMGLCLYGAAPPSLTPLQTSLDFGTLAVGDFSEQTLTIRNDGTGGAIRRVYLSTSEIDGNFQFTTPCNPDGSYCDVDLTAAVAASGTFQLGVKCRPQSVGTHTAQVFIGTDTFQLLSLGVDLTCTGAASANPALAVNPTTIEITSPVDVTDGSASVVVHLANAGSGTLTVRDVRTVDVDPGAGDDWTYTAAGTCSGQITQACMLSAGASVDIQLTFDPSQIGSRRAALLVAYRDTLDRTLEIPLDARGRGATLRRLGHATPLAFGLVPVGRMSELTVTLQNDGNIVTLATSELTAGTTPPFTVAPATPATVTPGMPRVLTLQCTPQAPGLVETTLTVTSSDVTSSVAIATSCEGTTNEVYANPTALMLGEIRTNAAAPTFGVQVLTTDTGTPLTIVGQPRLEPPNAAITLGPLSQLITPASFDVTVAPSSTGSLTGTIVLETMDDQTLRIPLAALAVDATYITSDTLDLGTFCVDQPTTSSNLTLLSTGTGSIELAAPALGQSPSPFALAYTSPSVYPHVLAPARAAVVAVTPQRQRTAMTVADTLTWQTDTPGAEATVATSLTARFIDSGGAIAPTALNFGEATVHLLTENGQRVVIQNCNPTPLVLDPPDVQTPFSIDSPSFPSMLNPNESIAFSVGFHPTRAGIAMDTLRITSPQLPGAPLEVTLIGNGKAGIPIDAGIEPGAPGDTSFYSCGCRSVTGNPLGALPLALAFACLLFRRRRARRGSR
jgi:Abnormal spindle-like microcephaly-assoc'd, ASPM-SPD-2-Hydin